MQEEIIKHSKKAYQKMKSSDHTISEKLKEIAIEIFIIVFAVTLSIWLHSWSEHKHQQHDVKIFLTDLKQDLMEDTSSMHHSLKDLTANSQNLNFMAKLDGVLLDSVGKAKGSLGFNSNLATTKINSGNYEGFKSSGRIGHIEQKHLKTLILKYYQELTPNVIEIEKLSHIQFSKLLDYMSDNAESDSRTTFLNKKFKFLLNHYIDFSKSNEETYKNAIHTAEEILSEIKKENH